jgi:excisionase family DNA binding protein
VSNARVQAQSYVTPAQVAADLGVNQSKVLVWIHRGELRAVNVAARLGGRPRWRIAEEALDQFLAARSAKPPAPVVRRRRRREDPAVTQFF